jgi:hypothetical protein
MVYRVESPRLVDALPDVARELQELLLAGSEGALAQSVPELRVVDRCRCGDDFCATFYTAPKPLGAYGPSHRNTSLDHDEGMIILDIVQDRIVCVEVLNRADLRRRLLELLP